MEKPTLVYFASRGRAELIRVILAEAGVDYDEHLVGVGTPPKDGRPTDFQGLKESGQLPFGAVPLWEEPGGFRLAQSAAIAMYLAQTHGLAGRDARETAECLQMLGAFDDFRGELRKVAMAEPAMQSAARAELVQTIVPRWLSFFDQLLARNHQGAAFVVGEDCSVADLALFYGLEVVRDNRLADLSQHPRLRSFYERMDARPRLRSWIESPRRYPPVLLPR